MNALLPSTRAAMVGRVWKQHWATAAGVAVIVAAADGLGAGFGGIVERITTEVTTEVPLACVRAVGPDVQIHSIAMAWGLRTDGDPAHPSRTSSLDRHPVDSHATDVGTVLTGDEEIRRAMASATCDSTTSLPAQNHAAGSGPP